MPWHPSVTQHYNGIIMGAMASQITSVSIVYSTVYSGADQRKHQSSASLAFVMGIHRWLVNCPHKGAVTRKMYPFDDVIMHHTKTGQRTLLYPCTSVVTAPITAPGATFLTDLHHGFYGNRFFIRIKLPDLNNMVFYSGRWTAQFITYFQRKTWNYKSIFTYNWTTSISTVNFMYLVWKFFSLKNSWF